MDSLWVTHRPYWGPAVGHQVRTRVSAPGRARKMEGASGSAWWQADGGSHRSWVPHPISEGCRPSEMNPSTDQVLTKVPMGLGRQLCWVSRSAMWMPVTPLARISSAHSARLVGSEWWSPTLTATSSSACLTNQDTIPGLAPQADTAVGPSGWAPARPAGSARKA